MNTRTIKIKKTGVVTTVGLSTAGQMIAGGYATPVDLPAADHGYEGHNVEQLKDEIRSRNSTRSDDAQLPVSGTKAELAQRLEDDDQQSVDNPTD